MRDILFKAKRKNWQELPKEQWWVKGYLVKKKCGRYTTTGYEEYEAYVIISEFSDGGIQFCYIDEDTICQYTGLTDKNGNMIWENDVVRFKHKKFDFDDGLEPWERTCLPNKKEYKRNYVVEFCNTPTHYGLRFRNGSIWFMVHKMTVVMHDTEVIGNIFDEGSELLDGKSELLEGGAV